MITILTNFISVIYIVIQKCPDRIYLLNYECHLLKLLQGIFTVSVIIIIFDLGCIMHYIPMVVTKCGLTIYTMGKYNFTMNVIHILASCY